MSMPDIYDQHNAAFAQAQAFVVMKDAERLATIAFKFPKDGAGRLWCYAHWIGLEMTRGHAIGYGYDKRSAAASSAVKRMPALPENYEVRVGPHRVEDCTAFKIALSLDDGHGWETNLRKAGFTVWQAI